MKARTLLVLGLFVIAVLALAPALLVCALVGVYDPLYAMAKATLEIARRVLGISLTVEGLGQIDRTASAVFMSNHLSFIDGPLLLTVIPQPVRIIFKEVLFWIPVVGAAMTFVGFVSVDRKGVEAGKASVKRAARLMRAEGYSFLIFPEGTRSLDGELQGFRRGGFFLALESGAPIVPVSILGTFEAMPKGSFFVRKSAIRVRFHPAVSVQGFDERRMPELTAIVRAAIVSGLKEEAS